MSISSFFIGSAYGSSGIVCDSKEDFLSYISEEIDRVNGEGEREHFDVTIEVSE